MLKKLKKLYEQTEVFLEKLSGQGENKEERKSQKNIIPIIDELYKREYNKLFRKTGDDESFARIMQKAPKGTPNKVAGSVKVAEVSKYEKEALKVISSNRASYKLEKEPSNPYDKNAIKVLGISKDYRKEESFLIGYLPKEVAKELSKFEILKPTICTIQYPSSSKTIGITLNIWSDREKYETIYLDLDAFDKTLEANLEALEREIKEKEENSNHAGENPDYRVTSHIPVINKSSERQYNTPYRKPNDYENVIRIMQKAPKGTQKKVAEFVKVSGISNYQKEVIKVISSECYSFKLEKDPKNPYDENAIKVLGVANNNGEEELLLVGYLQSETAKELSKYEILKATLRVIYFPTSSKSAGLRLDIWSKRNKPKAK